MTALLLLKNGERAKAQCCQCWRLHEPTDGHLKAAGASPNPAFICPGCMARITEMAKHDEQRQYR